MSYFKLNIVVLQWGKLYIHTNLQFPREVDGDMTHDPYEWVMDKYGNDCEWQVIKDKDIKPTYIDERNSHETANL